MSDRHSVVTCIQFPMVVDFDVLMKSMDNRDDAIANKQEIFN